MGRKFPLESLMPVSSFDCLPLFHDLPAHEREQIRAIFTPCSCYAGSTLFEQGAPAENLYLVVEGEVLVRFKPEDGPTIIVARIRSEGVVGWSAVLGSPSYTSEAVCATNSELLQVSGVTLREFCIRQPEIGSLVLERLAVVISERMRNTHTYVMTLLEQGLRIGSDLSV
jgi:CRP/FNR family transcriptional regulator, cyclic AMP receptor protein